MNPLPQSYVLVYRIDADNRIIWVNGTWSEFARSNHGEWVMPEHVLGRDLLGSIQDESMQAIYASIIGRVRAGTPVKFHYRCDAPDKRRTFAMEVRLLIPDEVEFSSTLIHEESRPSIALLEPGHARGGSLLRVCSWCQKVGVPDGSWLSVEEAVVALRLLEAEQLPAITHGICQPCHAGIMAKIA